MRDGSMPLPPELAVFAYLLDAHLCRTTSAGSAPWCGTPLSTIVQAGKMPLAETILDEPVLADGPGNGKSPLIALASQ
jgi:hypothetical protein